MTLFPPAPERADPPFRDAERPALDAWLDLHRATLLTKCAGLTPEQLGERSVPPSSLSLRGLLRHMTDVERAWYRRVLAGADDALALYWDDDDPDGDFDAIGRPGDDPDTAVPAELAAHLAEVAAARLIAAGFTSLDDVGAGLRHGEQVSLRWVQLHMIEEYARHNGHADLLRERIDGATGE